MQWLNFRHLYAFWAVCRHGGFQKAAKQIFVSQSTISSQVTQLEAYLGEVLLERSTRSVALTPRGAALLAYADEIFAKSFEINHIFRDKNESTAPTSIKIGMVGGISRNFMFGLIFQNLLEERDISIDLIDGSFDELTALLKGFELDLIFSLEKPRNKDLLALSYKRVESSPLCLTGTPEQIRKLKRKRTRPMDCEVYTFRHPYDRLLVTRAIEQRYSVDISVPVTTDDISLLRFLANAGRGLSLVPEIGVYEDLNAGHLSRIRIEDAPQVDFFAIFLKSGLHRRIIDEFLE